MLGICLQRWVHISTDTPAHAHTTIIMKVHLDGGNWKTKFGELTGKILQLAGIE